MACVLIQAHDMPKMRADVGELAGIKSSRVHFNAELDSRRQALLQTFGELPIESLVVICRRRPASPSSRRAAGASATSSPHYS